MIALVAILLRAGLTALVLLMVWSLFFGHSPKRTSPKKPSRDAKPGRFDANGKNISDGDFKEL
ncbi:MAG: hypothetical protein PHC61_09965 [Chitinivibrionales bacterium]|nr:hypothetical protein [Chitinivibrionales bacterium]